MTDSERIDWLERFVEERGGLLIHTGGESHPRLPGLGLNRSLRESIDSCGGSGRAIHRGEGGKALTPLQKQARKVLDKPSMTL